MAEGRGTGNAAFAAFSSGNRRKLAYVGETEKKGNAMFKFLFGRKGEVVEAKVETQREAFERVVDELNGLIAKQSVKPKVTLDPETGFVSFELPEQMADEALALPSPEVDETPASMSPSAEEEAQQTKAA